MYAGLSKARYARRMGLVRLAVLVAALGTVASVQVALESEVAAQPEHRQMGCDPVPPMTQDVPPPAGQAMRCGDNRRASYSQCTQTFGGGGCGGAAPTYPMVCRKAMEVCDGRDLGGGSCTKQGFARGALACSATCDSYNISACEPCFAGRGVTCGTLPGIDLSRDTIERIVVGNGGAVVIWAQHRNGTHALQVTMLGTAGVVTALTPLASWTDGQAPRLMDVAPVSTGWSIFYVNDGRTWEQRYTAKAKAVGPARDVGAQCSVVFAGQDTSGIWRVLMLSTAPPQLFNLGADGMGKELPVVAQNRLQRGDDLVFIVPIPDAKPDETDLAVFTTIRGFSGLWLWNRGRWFGGGQGTQLALDLGISPGSYSVSEANNQVVTTWTPKQGKSWTFKRSSTPASPPRGVFAIHPSVTQLRSAQSGKLMLSIARFEPKGSAARAVTALIAQP